MAAFVIPFWPTGRPSPGPGAPRMQRPRQHRRGRSAQTSAGRRLSAGATLRNSLSPAAWLRWATGSAFPHLRERLKD
jgi:hypothetical protein